MQTLGARVVTDTFRRLRKDARRLRLAILERERPGSPYLLEPDIKDGAGGQRDLDELTWHATLRAGEPCPGLEPLTAAELLTTSEAAAIAAAQHTLTAARWALHRADPRGGNQLTLDAAEIDGLDTQAVQDALEQVHHTLLAVRTRFGSGVPPTGSDVTLEDLRRFAGGGEDALAAAEHAAFHGRFEARLPGFGALMPLRRPALSHRFTVGAHCLRALQATHAELDGLGADRVEPTMRDVTLVAALAHDAGKRDASPGHAARGSEVAETAAVAFGLDATHARLAGKLVTEHLLLSDLAAHTDPSDEDAILAAAARLGEARLIAPLYALTVADMRATGPEVWTSWRAALIGDLAAKLEDALAPDVDGAGIVAAAEATRASALRAAASVGASRAVLDFLAHAPLRYLARRTDDDVLRDARLARSIAGPGAPGRFSFSVSVGPADGTWLVDVVTRDRPGLFAIVSGSLALAGLGALSAEAFTDRSGIALDTFVVTSATRAAADTGTWNTFERTLGLALTGALDLDTRLAERRKHYPSAPSASTVPTVEIRPRGMFTTGVRVRAADRVGLLHDLARAIASQGLDIRRAAITTIGGVAADVFDVTDAEGAPPDPESLRRHLVPALESAARGAFDPSASASL